VVGLDPADIPAVLATVDDLWSLPSRFAETGAHQGYSQITVALAGRIELPQFAPWLASFAPVRRAWLSRLDPGGYIVEHIDAGPHHERWQIPLTEHGALSAGGVPAPVVVGVPYRVRHDWWHSVANDSTGARVALVIDRDVMVQPSASPLRLKYKEAPPCR
jgi:hypothetical protein